MARGAFSSIAGLPVTDSLIVSNFDKVYRRGQAEVNTRLRAVQDRLKVPQGLSSGLIMLLIKASPEVRSFMESKPRMQLRHALFPFLTYRSYPDAVFMTLHLRVKQALESALILNDRVDVAMDELV